MSHELALTADGRTAMAWVGETPWHGLGQELEAGADIDTWAVASGMDMTLGSTDVETASGIVVPDKKIIYREDTMEGLSVVSNRYKVVQPIEVLEFFKRYAGNMNAELETAGLLFGGRRYWAMARLDGEINLGGDITRPYLLLNTSCDGSTSTTARMTSVRVVCNNTLSMATGRNSSADVTVRHNTTWDAAAVHTELESQYLSLRAHADMLESLARVKITDDKAENFLRKLLDKNEDDEVKLSRNSRRIMELYRGEALGADFDSSRGTAYGLLQATTQFMDHEYGRSQDTRLAEAWTGYTAKVKANFADDLLAAVA